MKKIVIPICLLLSLILGAIVGRFTIPTKEVIIEKEVEKIVEVESKTAGLAKKYLFKFLEVEEKTLVLPWESQDARFSNAELYDFANQEYELWENLMNEIFLGLKEVLPKEEIEKIAHLQVEWMEYRDRREEEIGQITQGGNMSILAKLTAKINITRDRCLELIELYMD